MEVIFHFVDLFHILHVCTKFFASLQIEQTKICHDMHATIEE